MITSMRGVCCVERPLISGSASAIIGCDIGHSVQMTNITNDFPGISRKHNFSTSNRIFDESKLIHDLTAVSISCC